MKSLMLALKEAEINTEAIPVHMQQEQTETQHIKDKNKTPTGMVHEEQIKKNTALSLPTEEYWRQATS